MYNHLLSVAVIAVSLVVAAVPAEAQVRRGQVAVGRGPSGHKAVQWRGATRQQGSAAIRRGAQTSDGRGYRHERRRDYGQGRYTADRTTQFNNGRGAATARHATWGNGQFNGTRTTTFNNGTSFGRATSATRNGDGSASYATTVTGPRGGSRTVSGFLPRHP